MLEIEAYLLASFEANSNASNINANYNTQRKGSISSHILKTPLTSKGLKKQLVFLLVKFGVYGVLLWCELGVNYVSSFIHDWAKE